MYLLQGQDQHNALGATYPHYFALGPAADAVVVAAPAVDANENPLPQEYRLWAVLLWSNFGADGTWMVVLRLLRPWNPG